MRFEAESSKSDAVHKMLTAFDMPNSCVPVEQLVPEGKFVRSQVRDLIMNKVQILLSKALDRESLNPAACALILTAEREAIQIIVKFVVKYRNHPKGNLE